MVIIKSLKVKIRPARQPDLGRILEINLKATLETCSQCYPLETLKKWMGDRTESLFQTALKNGQLHVAESNDRIGGFLDVVPGQILAIYTDPKLERRGIGQALIRKGISEATRDGQSVIVFSSLNAVTFYEKFGFQKEGKITHSRNGVDVQMIRMHYTPGNPSSVT